MTIAGLKLIVPTSVAGSGVSVSSTGKITFSTASSVSVNGCFSATYDNYLTVINVLNTTGTTGALIIRFRASGTDNSGANTYVFQRLLVGATSVAGNRFTSNQAGFGPEGVTLHGGAHGYFYGPYLTAPTAFRSVTATTDNSATLYDSAGTHNQSTAYDGFSIYLSAGTFSGTMCVYGLSQ